MCSFHNIGNTFCNIFMFVFVHLHLTKFLCHVLVLAMTQIFSRCDHKCFIHLVCYFIIGHIHTCMNMASLRIITTTSRQYSPNKQIFNVAIKPKTKNCTDLIYGHSKRTETHYPMHLKLSKLARINTVIKKDNKPRH